MRYDLGKSSILLSSLIVLAASKATTINVSSGSKDAKGPVDPSFPGFAFEQASFYDYAFDECGKPNAFSQNLIKSVLDRTGGTPLLRVGGTSGDHAQYNADQKEPVSCRATACGPFIPQDKTLKIGPSYFEAFKNFPGAKYEFMVPFDRKDLDNTLAWTAAGLKVIDKEALYAIEIGNEPNFYSWWSPKAYLDKFMEFATAITEKHPSLAGKRIFQSLDVASGSAEKLSTEKAFADKLNQNVSSIKQIAYHYYQSLAPENYEGLQKSILHTDTTRRLSGFEDDIKYLRQHHQDIGFVLSEVGDNLGKGGNLAFRNSLATAIWAIDFQLHAMSIGVDRVNFQQIYKPGFCMWEPVNSTHWDIATPMVRPNYYSQPFVADFIGKGGRTKVASILSEEKLAAYAAYEDGKLARIAIVNLNLGKASGEDRKKTDIVLDDLAKGVESVTVHQLNSPHGSLAQTDITYKGLEWSFESKGLQKQVRDDSKTVNIKGGKVTISIEEASAIILEV